MVEGNGRKPQFVIEQRSGRVDVVNTLRGMIRQRLAPHHQNLQVTVDESKREIYVFADDPVRQEELEAIKDKNGSPDLKNYTVTPVAVPAAASPQRPTDSQVIRTLEITRQQSEHYKQESEQRAQELDRVRTEYTQQIAGMQAKVDKEAADHCLTLDRVKQLEETLAQSPVYAAATAHQLMLSYIKRAASQIEKLDVVLDREVNYEGAKKKLEELLQKCEASGVAQPAGNIKAELAPYAGPQRERTLSDLYDKLHPEALQEFLTKSEEAHKIDARIELLKRDQMPQDTITALEVPRDARVTQVKAYRESREVWVKSTSTLLDDTLAAVATIDKLSAATAEKPGIENCRVPIYMHAHEDAGNYHIDVYFPTTKTDATYSLLMTAIFASERSKNLAGLLKAKDLQQAFKPGQDETTGLQRLRLTLPRTDYSIDDVAQLEVALRSEMRIAYDSLPLKTMGLPVELPFITDVQYIKQPTAPRTLESKVETATRTTERRTRNVEGPKPDERSDAIYDILGDVYKTDPSIYVSTKQIIAALSERHGWELPRHKVQHSLEAMKKSRRIECRQEGLECVYRWKPRAHLDRAPKGVPPSYERSKAIVAVLGQYYQQDPQKFVTRADLQIDLRAQPGFARDVPAYALQRDLTQLRIEGAIEAKRDGRVVMFRAIPDYTGAFKQ